MKSVAPEREANSERPEREPVPEFLRDTEQPLLGLALLLIPMAHSIRAVLWAIDPPERGGRAIAAVAAVFALLTFVVWRYLGTRLRSEGASPWVAGVVVGLMTASVLATFGASGGLPLFALPMAMLIVVRNDVGRLAASAIILALPAGFLDLSDPEVRLSIGTAVAVALSANVFIRRRRDARTLRLALRARLAEVTKAADEWAARQTAVIAGLAHDIRGPLQGAGLAIQMAALSRGDDLDPVLRESGEQLERRCSGLSERLSEVISDLRSPVMSSTPPETSDRAALLQEWHATEQVPLPVFMLSLMGTLYVVSGILSGVWFGDRGVVLMVLTTLYGVLVALPRAGTGWLGADRLTWLILTPGLLWTGAQAVGQSGAAYLALAMSIFWVGAVSSRAPRTVLVAGSAIVVASPLATTLLDQTFIFAGIVAVAYAYRRSVITLSDAAAEWALRLERRHERVRRATSELDRSLERHVHEIRRVAQQLVDDARRLRALAHEKDRGGPVDMYDRAYEALSGLETLIPAGYSRSGPTSPGQPTASTGRVTAWLSSVFSDRIASKNGTLVFEGSPDVELPLSEAALKKILINLVDNAVKFSPEGGRVVVGAHRGPADGCVILTVTDQGQGIPDEEVGRLFRWFEQGPYEPGEAREGFGIGLAVVQGLVHDAGGRIDVESQPGSTCIRLTFEA